MRYRTVRPRPSQTALVSASSMNQEVVSNPVDNLSVKIKWNSYAMIISEIKDMFQ